MTGEPEERVRFNERLDHLQAQHPYWYNLATGLLIGGALVLLLRVHWVLGVAYALSWMLVRGWLWGDGRVLRRQYEVRLVRVEAERAARRRRG